MASKRITVEEWLEIAETVITEFVERFSDDGKISINDALSLLLVLIKSIVRASKTEA